MTSKQKIAMIAIIIYTTIMAVAMWSLKNIFHSSYIETSMVNYLIYFEAVMTAFSVFVYFKYFKGTAFNKPKEKARKVFDIVFAIIFLVLIALIVFIIKTGTFQGKDSLLIIKILLTTLFVGIGEELIYRAIVLHAFLENGSKFKALLISSALFSGLHIVNILGGLPLAAMLVQLFLTFCFGLMLGSLVLEKKNLLPFIIYHWLWDFLIFLGAYVGANTSFSYITLGVQVVMGFVFLFIVRRDDKKAYIV